MSLPEQPHLFLYVGADELLNVWMFYLTGDVYH